MYEQEKDDIDHEILKLVQLRMREKNAALMSEDNDLHYSHGHSWSHIDAATGDRNVGTFAEASAESTISIQRIVDNDASIIGEFVEDMSEKMYGQMARSVYQMVNEAAEATGNVIEFSSRDHVTAGDGSNAIISDLMQMLEKVEFGVNNYGIPSPPQLHLHPSNTQLIDALTKTPSIDEERKMEELMLRKETEAIGREAERLGRFRRS